MEQSRPDDSSPNGPRFGERGATATEYAALLALIALIIAVGVGAFGTALGTYFSTAATTLRTLLGIP